MSANKQNGIPSTTMVLSFVNEEVEARLLEAWPLDASYFFLVTWGELKDGLAMAGAVMMCAFININSESSTSHRTQTRLNRNNGTKLRTTMRTRHTDLCAQSFVAERRGANQTQWHDPLINTIRPLPPRNKRSCVRFSDWEDSWTEAIRPAKLRAEHQVRECQRFSEWSD